MRLPAVSDIVEVSAFCSPAKPSPDVSATTTAMAVLGTSEPFWSLRYPEPKEMPNVAAFACEATKQMAAIAMTVYFFILFSLSPVIDLYETFVSC
jgi:hypothetical protein